MFPFSKPNPTGVASSRGNAAGAVGFRVNPGGDSVSSGTPLSAFLNLRSSSVQSMRAASGLPTGGPSMTVRYSASSRPPPGFDDPPSTSNRTLASGVDVDALFGFADGPAVPRRCWSIPSTNVEVVNPQSISGRPLMSEETWSSYRSMPWFLNPADHLEASEKESKKNCPIQDCLAAYGQPSEELDISTLAQTLNFLYSDEEDDLDDQLMKPTQLASRHLGNESTTTANLATAKATTDDPRPLISSERSSSTVQHSTLAQDEARIQPPHDIITVVSWEEMLKMLEEAQINGPVVKIHSEEATPTSAARATPTSSAMTAGKRKATDDVSPFERRRVPPINSPFSCSFCRTNGEKSKVYKSHSIRDSDGNVSCPALFQHVCELCGSTGSSAHTRKYCPLYQPNAELTDVKALKSTKRTAAGRRH